MHECPVQTFDAHPRAAHMRRSRGRRSRGSSVLLRRLTHSRQLCTLGRAALPNGRKTVARPADAGSAARPNGRKRMARPGDPLAAAPQIGRKTPLTGRVAARMADKRAPLAGKATATPLTGRRRRLAARGRERRAVGLATPARCLRRRRLSPRLSRCSQRILSDPVESHRAADGANRSQ